jgi:hypothetical protein
MKVLIPEATGLLGKLLVNKKFLAEQIVIIS